jgi:single-strand DNA-binding protein
MAGLNKVTLIGRLGADPESRSFSNGGKVVNLRLATSETWKDKTSGERKERTEWHSVAIFNEGLAGIAERFLRKGSQCYVEGQLETRKWQDQSGADRYSTEVVLRPFNGSIVLLDGKSGGDREDASARGDNRTYGQTSGERNQAYRAAADLDDEVPF